MTDKIMFDKFLIRAIDKDTGKVWVSETVTRFGFWMMSFVSGFVGDPYRGHCRWYVERTHKGFITKIVDKVKVLYYNSSIVNK